MKNIEESKDKYQKLFSDDKSKADAFDKIAEKYYFSNFGSINKSDFDTLMFSLYIEQILKNNASDLVSYSDYTLSKLLGITQTRISNLKVKKELLYPYEEFEWKESFLAIIKNAVFEDQKIKLFIPDKNLYLEIKNAIETDGGFVEVQLTSNLLQVRLAFILDLLISISGDENKEKETIKKELKDIITKKNKDIDFSDKDSIGKKLLKQTPKTITDIIGETIPVFGGVVKTIAENIFEVIKDGQE